jgi:hypothetical protein
VLHHGELQPGCPERGIQGCNPHRRPLEVLRLHAAEPLEEVHDALVPGVIDEMNYGVVGGRVVLLGELEAPT